MTVTIGINGFGRIGRCTLAHIAESARNDVQVVKINAPGPIETHAHLLRYDSIHGRFPGDVTVKDQALDLGRGPIDVMSSYEMGDLDWSGCDVVLECTGKFNDGTKANAHLDRGAKSVLISAPAKNVQRTVVYGVNHRDLVKGETMISNGSCTTNCLAPLAKVLDEGIGIESGIMTTIHSYTGDQPTLDRRHADLYRARAAAMAMIPTSTGAAKALGEVLPNLKGKLDGSAVRVPTPNVSAVDLTFYASRDVTVEDVNEVVAEAAAGRMGAVLSYDPEQKVSIDFNHTTHSSIFAPDQTKVVGKRMVRVLAWYDNEWGFSARMADVAAAMGRLLH
ncbi:MULTISPECIES: type I glyceraldehyde-3-phosphate dehydrogenase [Mameliella]|uniref:type I glyceraldehyde-3-phosphate dehydrogenase n=1 Tax=Mameliella TaxID=1434019 RepID=UPI0008410C1B|nr:MULTISPECIES: type I glyceraldehyde-3-phosphate dehydrogenase [Mameliella]MCR9275843.1 type I glyceraldehyde-3-phosphate dehydrogenase [Paracoccaceae bacterium]ODM49958.1 type I glyceraldehyde-3-phosphate dehydrogenase [Ruegeria sp. PBVC088]MBY6119131.1 type I glyceraldehyde-3-phosphate dehydrogenase [Mameliella alba]MDD9733064.1 type I glyceraldehyde-3-phosphate dehydrogenase [Mameliella sp. AT18]OWV45206.1 type I glyceraldehyde-3-phosphate dehydrogenase [Mameliella alba]